MIQWAGDISIKKINHNLKRSKNPSPWWDEECQKWIDLRRRTVREYINNPTREMLNRLDAVQKRSKKILKSKKKNPLNLSVSHSPGSLPAG